MRNTKMAFYQKTQESKEPVTHEDSLEEPFKEESKLSLYETARSNSPDRPKSKGGRRLSRVLVDSAFQQLHISL